MIISVITHSQTELIDMTASIEQAIKTQNRLKSGYIFLFVPHTTAAITINESADSSVKTDILAILNKIIPFEADYRHLEGNSAAHIKSSLIGVSEIVAVENQRLILGRWQGIFFCEFDGPRNRKLHINFLSEII